MMALVDFQRSIEYHEAQQRMVTEYFEQWRNPLGDVCVTPYGNIRLRGLPPRIAIRFL